jgi:hypothetical protein
MSFIRWLFGKPEKPKPETMLWVSEMPPPEPGSLIGRPVDFNGRKGKIVGNTMLTVDVEWETTDG